MRTILIAVLLCALLACDWSLQESKTTENCTLGINLKNSRGDVKKAIQAKIDSLKTHIDEKKKDSGDTWTCEIQLKEYQKLKDDFDSLPAGSDPQPGFEYVAEKLRNSIKEYGLEHYVDITESMCRGQHLYLEATFSSPENNTFLEKRIVKYNHKQKYKTAADANIFVTTYQQINEFDIVPEKIFLVYCLRGSSPANPNDISRLKSLYPDEKIFLEGEFDGFHRKAMDTNLGDGVVRPEVYCAYLKNWVIRSPALLDNNSRY